MWLKPLFGLLVLSGWPLAVAAGTTLEDIAFATLPGDRVRIELRLSGPPPEPKVFAVHDPARIVLDFPSVRLALAQRTKTIQTGLTRSVTAVQGAERARVVVHLIRFVPYRIETREQSVFITIGIAARAGAVELPAGEPVTRVRDIQFEPAAGGVARVHVLLTDPPPVVLTQENEKRIVLEFRDTALPEELNRVLDVTDFATPILTIDAFPWGPHTRVIIHTTGKHDYLGYQTHGVQTGEFVPLREAP
jgi:type IV pilus assembly protein PilQ